MTHCLAMFGVLPTVFKRVLVKKKAYATLKNIDLLFKQIRECGLKSSFFSLNAIVGSALLYKESSQVHVKHEMIYQVLFYPSLHAEGQRCLDNF